MNQKKMKIIFGSFIVAVLVIMFLFIKFEFNKSSKPVSIIPIINEEEVSKMDNDASNIPVQTPYYEDAYTKTLLSDATQTKTTPKIIGATNDLLLFKSYHGYLYIYDQHEDVRHVIDSQINKSIFSNDGKYVIYTKDEEKGNVIYYYNVELQTPTEVLLNKADGMIVDNLSYDKGIVGFSYHHANEPQKFSIQTIIIPELENLYTGSMNHAIIPKTSNIVSVYNHQFYTYMPNTNSLHFLQFGVNTLERIKLTLKPVSPSGLDFSPSGNYSLINNVSMAEHRVFGSFGILSYLNVINAKWYSDTLLLIQDDSNLFLYNTQTKTEKVLATNVSTFSKSNNGSIYFVDGKENAYALRKK